MARTRKPAAVEQRKKHICAAGANLFAERGYGNVTMEEVARAAELGKATLYYYFPNKQALYAQVLRRELAGLEQAMETLRLQGDLWQDLEEALRFALSFFRSRRQALSLIIPLLGLREQDLARLVGAELAQDIQRWHRPVMAKLRSGWHQLSPGTSEEAWRLLLGGLIMALATRLYHDEQAALEPLVHEIVDMIRRAAGRG